MKIKSLKLFILLIFTLLPVSAYAYNETCTATPPAKATASCCVPPQAIIDGGGCPATDQVWIGGLEGSCQVLVYSPNTTCPTAGQQFKCSNNTCYTPPPGPICHTSNATLHNVDIGTTAACCTDGQVAVYEDNSTPTIYTDDTWVCGAAGGSSQWTTSGTNIYYNTGNVGIGTDTPTGGGKLHVKDTGWVQATFESSDSSGGIQLVSKPVGTPLKSQKYQLQSLTDGGFIIYDATDGVYDMKIDTNGNVGIGTQTPGAKLEVAGGAGTTTFRLNRSSVTSPGYWDQSISHTDSSNYGSLYFTPSVTTGDFAVADNAHVIRFYIDTSSGNVGIGTTTPGTLLNVSSETAPLVRIDPGTNGSVDPTLWLRDTDNTAGFAIVYDNSVGSTYFDNYYDHANGDIYFRTKVAGTAVNVMTLDAGGNVGIGTTAPDSPLTVEAGNDCGLDATHTGHITTGEQSGTNICMDDDEIMARNKVASATLRIQNNGGEAYFGGNIYAAGNISATSYIWTENDLYVDNDLYVGGSTYLYYTDIIGKLKLTAAPAVNTPAIDAIITGSGNGIRVGTAGGNAGYFTNNSTTNYAVTGWNASTGSGGSFGSAGGYGLVAYSPGSNAYLGGLTYGLYTDGKVYIGDDLTMFGDLTVNGTCSGGGTCDQDIAEYVHSKNSDGNYVCDSESDEKACNFINGFVSEFESGDVVCLDEENAEYIKFCDGGYDNTVLSVINYDAAFYLGGNKPYPMSLAGNVPVKVICDDPISPGDMLVTAPKKGYAMKLNMDDSSLTLKDVTGTVFAKATERCASGEKVIRAWLD